MTAVTGRFTGAARLRLPHLPRIRPAHVAAAAAVGVVVVLLSLNLTGAPYFEDDEGTYVAQAQAVLHQGALAPYTYFYDHPPGGWIQLAGWFALTGDGVPVGGALADGRIFMVLVQAVSMLLVLHIGRRLTGSLWAGVLASLLFGLSPYAFFFHRRVLLDNLAAMWLLASAALVLSRRITLTRVALAAVALGVAVWSKEIAITLLPALGLLAVRRTPREARSFALGGWVAIAGGVVSLYALMALLKGELFPRGSLLGGDAPHVSLLCSLQWQSSRGSDGGLLQPTSGFWTSAGQWAAQDPVLVLGGTIGAVLALTLFRRDIGLSMLGLAVLSFWLFLGRGGITLGLYLVPLVPFLALCLVGAAWAAGRAFTAAGRPGRRRAVQAAGALGAAAALAVAGVGLRSPANSQLWTTDPTTGQGAAAAWVQQHLPHDSRIVMDMYLYPALHDPAPDGGAPFRDAEYYWKAADDPAILKQVFKGRWQSVDYVIVTPQLLADTSSQGFPVVRAALDHSVSVATFDTGYRVDVRRVSPEISAPAYSWKASTPATAPNCMSGST